MATPIWVTLIEINMQRRSDERAWFWFLGILELLPSVLRFSKENRAEVAEAIYIDLEPPQRDEFVDPFGGAQVPFLGALVSSVQNFGPGGVWSTGWSVEPAVEPTDSAQPAVEPVVQ